MSKAAMQQALEALQEAHQYLASSQKEECRYRVSLAIRELRAAIAAVSALPYSVASAMPGTDAWTLAVFSAKEAPVGTPVYAEPQQEPTS